MPIPSNAAPPRTLLREQAFLSLRTAIVEGVLEPGERLVDAELCEWLGVSRTPVREALARLQQIGLVRIRPGSSTIVSPLDVRTAVEAQAVAASLHELAVREAVPLLKEHHLEQLTAANETFADALRAADVDAAIAADDAFHGVFVQLCGNRTVTAVLDDVIPLLRRMERARFTTLLGRASVAQHRRIIQLAYEAQADQAAQEARANWLTLSPPND